MFPRDAVPVLLLGFVALPTVPALFDSKLLKGFRVQFGGIGFLVLHPGGLSEDVIAIGLPVLLFVGGGFVALPIVPGGTLIMLPGGGVPVLLPGGSAFVAFGKALTTPGGTLIVGPVSLPGGGSAFPAELGVPVGLATPLFA